MVSNGARVNLEGLRHLYAEDEAAQSILDHFASRERNWGTSNVDRILDNVRSGGTDLSRGDVIRVFKSLESLGCGTFKVGRKGWPSRFEWTAQMVSVGQAAAGETEHVEEANEEEVGEEESISVLKHSYRLRPDLTVSLELPKDFDANEAARMAEFIKTLPFDARTG